MGSELVSVLQTTCSLFPACPTYPTTLPSSASTVTLSCAPLLHSSPVVMDPSDSPWVAFDSRGDAFFRPAHFSERVPPCPSCFSPSSPPSPFCNSCSCSTPAPCSSCFSPSSPPSTYCLSCISSSTAREEGKSRNTDASSIKEIKRKKPLFMNIPPTKELRR